MYFLVSLGAVVALIMVAAPEANAAKPKPRLHADMHVPVVKEEDMKKKMEDLRIALRDICLNKTKANLDMIMKTYEGDFQYENDTNTKCFVNCIMNESGLMKEDKLNLAAFDNIIEKIPSVDIKERMAKALENCKNTADATDPCATAMQFSKCVYMFDNEIFSLM